MSLSEKINRYIKAGQEYWKKRGLFSRCKCWMADVSHNAGVNKKTKRLTNKSERQQVRTHLGNVSKEEGKP